ncbi:enolase C-terminal domain-like protein [Sphingobacterium deserti]|uniref:Mandelate racemase/muconate lactonizing protein n=1 Tax=Sphingobacterium deserti TaxID=1229276 RepID=A0A0B8T6V3_9SPHI|nr:enolase C-terminal domain-like protein [Sphingobacterium deserti]KGE13150.1 Mandelate racemase/muconate lactonizing protein [Sphingobacterium deserti]
MRRRTFLHALNMGIASTTLFGTDLFAMQTKTAMDKELGYHRIKDIRFSNVQLRYPRLVGKNARLDLHGHGPQVDICTIHTDKGAMGWASLRGSRKEAEPLAKELLGKSVADVFQTNIGLTAAKYIPFDIALHDLAGVILNKPVFALLGRESPIIHDCYSGMLYFDDLEPKEKPAGVGKIVEECKQDYDLGYRQFKLKIGRGHRWMSPDEGLKRDIEVTKQVAAAFPDCKILVDGNNGFTVDRFTEYLQGIAGINLFWIEEPFHETVADYTKLRAWLKKENIKTLLADGEADPDQRQLKELIEKKLLDVHLTDIEGLGFTNWRKLMPELKRMGAQASPHAWGSLLKTYYTAHLSGGLGNTATIEGVSSVSDDVDLSGYKLQEGKLTPPSSPGFGMKLLKKV